MSEQTPIRALSLRYHANVLDPSEVSKIHESALEVLSRVGIATSSDKLLKLMADHGQAVDFQEKRVRLDPGFVERQCALAPRHFTLAGREPSRDLVLDGKHGYLSPDGCAPQILDLDTGKRRSSTKEDLGTLARLCDALPEIGLLWRSVAAGDTPNGVRSLHEVEAQLNNTTKHLQTGAGTDAFNARGVVELCRTVVGGEEALRERPILSSLQCIISPLFWDEGPIDAFEIYSAAGIPISIISMAIACATTPATVAGLVVLTIAEILSGLVILQTMAPGAKALCTAYPATMDLHSGSLNLAAGPDDAIAGMAAVQVLRHLGLPCATGMLGAGSKASDWQAGVQSALTAAKNAMMPADIFNGAGGIYGSNVFSPIQLMLDCEVFDMVSRWTQGFSVDDEHIGMNIIEEVGPAGHFLASPHTLEHMRELWRSKYMDTSSWEERDAAGLPDAPAAAEAEVRRILREHQPEPLPEDVAAQLRRIVSAYEAEAPEEPD
jgi:trimethylamine---corrinoid protein Co-methyltransferase